MCSVWLISSQHKVKGVSCWKPTKFISWNCLHLNLQTSTWNLEVQKVVHCNGYVIITVSPPESDQRWSKWWAPPLSWWRGRSVRVLSQVKKRWMPGKFKSGSLHEGPCCSFSKTVLTCRISISSVAPRARVCSHTYMRLLVHSIAHSAHMHLHYHLGLGVI